MKNRQLPTRFITVMFLSLLIMAMPLKAAAGGGSLADKNWDFSLAPLYLWGVNIEGESTLGVSGSETNVDHADLFDSLEGAFSLNFSGVHRSRFGFNFDFLYLNVGKDADTGLGAVLDYNLKTLLTSLAASYRLTDNDRHAFDALLGVRYARLEVDVEFDTLPIAESERIGIVQKVRHFDVTDEIWILK